MAFQSTVYRGSQQENIETLYANWQALKTQAELAATTYKRGENLYQQGVISRQRRDEMLAAQTSARETAEASYQQYARAKRGSTEQQNKLTLTRLLHHQILRNHQRNHPRKVKLKLLV